MKRTKILSILVLFALLSVGAVPALAQLEGLPPGFGDVKVGQQQNFDWQAGVVTGVGSEAGSFSSTNTTVDINGQVVAAGNYYSPCPTSLTGVVGIIGNWSTTNTNTTGTYSTSTNSTSLIGAAGMNQVAAASAAQANFVLVSGGTEQSQTLTGNANTTFPTGSSGFTYNGSQSMTTGIGTGLPISISIGFP